MKRIHQKNSHSTFENRKKNIFFANFRKISQNHTKSAKKTRDFLQKLQQKTKKSIEMDGISKKSMIENGRVRRSPARVASKTVSFPSSKTSTCRKILRKSSQNRIKNSIFYWFTIVILIFLIHYALPNLSRAKKSGSHSRQVASRIPANLEIWKKNPKISRFTGISGLACLLWDPLFLARLNIVI